MGSIRPGAEGQPPLLPNIVDHAAVEDPERVFCWSPKSSRYSDGCYTVRMPDLARAVNRAARWIESTLGKSTKFETLGYMGPNDVRYFILVLASIKTAYQLLLPSLRNSVENNCSLVDQMDLAIMLHAHSTSVHQIAKACPKIRDVEVPELDWFLDPEPVEPYPFEKTYAQAEHEPAYVLHSSGSTGPPKPIVIRHGGMENLRRQTLTKQTPEGPLFAATFEPGTVLFSPMPMFHAAGIFASLVLNLFANLPTIMPPPTVPLTVAVVCDAIEHFDVGWAQLPPSTLEEISRDEAALDAVAKVGTVTWGGGPMSETAGNILCKRTFLCNTMGSTEAGLYPVLVPRSSSDFAWFHFPSTPEFDFRDRGKRMYELVFSHRIRDPHLVFSSYSFPNTEEYATKDLYVKHPTREGLWKHVARADDVLVLSNGEKVVGIPIEGELHQSPLVDAALVLGHGRFQVAALVEPTAEARRALSDQDILKKLMPSIRNANKQVPGHAQLMADHVRLTAPDKPMTRTPKGSVMRKATLAMYEEEIDNLYENDSAAFGADASSYSKLFGDDVGTTERNLADVVSNTTEAHEIARDTDFFSVGVDSLQVLALVKQLKSKVKTEVPFVNAEKTVVPSFIYSNPTIATLAEALIALKDHKGERNEEKTHQRAMGEMLNEFTHDMPPHEEGLTFILTGSTGSLGTYLLDELMTSPRVRRVYCLNRSEDGLARQTEAFKSRGLAPNFPEGKTVFLHADLAAERLGLVAPDYERLRREATHILHNAWPVNFNQALRSFRPQVQGVRRLVDLSAAGARRPDLLFTSTIATANRWRAVYPGAVGRVPEKVLGDPRVPAPTGYAESKYVAEHVLAEAVRMGVSSVIVHVGQLCGPVTKPGIWNRQEWFPSIVFSSKHLGLIPESFGATATVDWVPVDTAAAILLELAGLDGRHGAGHTAAGPAQARVHNLVNPVAVPWHVLVRVLQRRFPAARVVSFAAWLDALRASAAAADADAVANPAIKLLDFYEGAQADAAAAPQFETRDAVRVSKTMADMQGASDDWMETWMKQWGM